MESCKHTHPNERILLPLLCAAAGTALLAFVPSGAWLNGAETAEGQLSAILLKAALTTALLWIVPSLWARAAHVTSPWTLLGLSALAFGCSMLIGRDAAKALYTTLLAALPGAGLYSLQRLKLSEFRTVLYASFVVLAALFGFVCLPDRIAYGDAYRGFRNAVMLFEQTQESTNALEIGFGDVTVRELLALYRQDAEVTFVPMLLSVSMAAGLINTLFSHLWNRNGGAPLEKLSPFETWRCERTYVIVIAIAAIVTMIPGYFGAKPFDALAALAEVMWRMPCTLAGLCVLYGLGKRFKKGWIVWVAGALLVALPAPTGVALTILGMMGSLRKPTNVGEDGGRK